MNAKTKETPLCTEVDQKFVCSYWTTGSRTAIGWLVKAPKTFQPWDPRPKPTMSQWWRKAVTTSPTAVQRLTSNRLL